MNEPLLPDYLVGTGGWAYFKVPNEPSLKAYSRVFGFVEVNYTFYEYPEQRIVERWRKIVPKEFTFAVRCHQDLTHRIGLRPVDTAYEVIGKMKAYCRILQAPFLILETPSSYKLNKEKIADAKDFFSNNSLNEPQWIWEIRAPLNASVVRLMKDFNIVHCTDLSKEEPSLVSDAVYSRLFGKGEHNIYQFTDVELAEIDQKAQKNNPKVIVLSYHGVRMNTDASRFVQYKKTGTFMPITSFTGVESVRAVLTEDAIFPSSKEDLIKDQGWKVVDLKRDLRVHLSEILSGIPEKIYQDIGEVTNELEALH